MKISILCADGSPLGISSKTVWGDDWRTGVGGAELALITMCEEWVKSGYEVVLYNDPNEKDASPFEQRDQNEFDPSADRDILIIFRTPNNRAIGANGKKVWWSTDQYTSQDFAPFAPHVDEIVCISPYHAKYFEKTYGITGTTVIDLPVRVDDYGGDIPTSIDNRLIFSSVPDRGLNNLWRMWPSLRSEVPNISLVITSDYRLWGAPGAQNEQHKMKWLSHEGIEFIGAVPRQRLVREQLKAQLHLFPCNYEELFCIAIAESQHAGVYTITSGIGALQTTNMCKVIAVDPNDPRNDVLFIDAAVEALNGGRLHNMQLEAHNKAKTRFKPEKILKQWDEKIFK